MKTDVELQRNVLGELKFEPAVHAAEIGVIAKDGIVTLTGFVPNYWEKVAAERAAKRVFGVRGVAEEIRVNLPAFYQRTDADIARAAANALEWNTLVPPEKVKVTVSEGFVKLEGEVDWQYQKTAARDAVHLLAGVQSVDNQITVKPKVTPMAIKADIVSAFKRSAELDARHIDVDATEDKVVLKGKVRNLAEREEAERTAWAAAGVGRVVNQLQIQL